MQDCLMCCQEVLVAFVLNLQGMCFQFPHVFCMFSAEHSVLERLGGHIFADGFGISGF